MPTILAGTVSDSGQTNLGSYSLCFPYYIAGKDYYAMLLNCRNSSNTAQNILRTGKCAINFVTDERKYFKEVVRLGWPGDTPEEKMKDCIFTFEDGIADTSDGKHPQVVKESFQVIECTWMKDLDNGGECKPGQLDGYEGPYHDFNGITSKFGATFILRVDKILMKEKYYNAIVNGVRAKDFPRVPVYYGYRDSKNCWYARFTKAIPELLPIRATTVDSVKYAADRIDDKIKFTDDACAMLVNVPRIFLPTALRGCVAWARENNVTVITAEHMKIINDKRSKEKKK